MRYLKFALRGLAYLAAFFLLYVAAILVYGTWTDFQPEGTQTLTPIQVASSTDLPDSLISLAIWNIGYAGLGEESDFFYDGGGFLFSGGKMIRTERPLVEKNLAGIVHFAKTTKADIFLFQEVDFSSKRSYFTNHVDSIGKALPAFGSWYSVNYLVDRVPVPLMEPWRAYGKANSGLLTLSRFQPAAAERVQLPGKYPWPNRMFQLDRCAAVFRYPLKNGKELVVLNIHNAAHDKGGKIKAQQMQFLRAFFLEEYEQKGNFVIAGGDWNQCPPFFPFDTFMPEQAKGFSQINIDPEFLPAEWRWIYDPTIPSNRKINKPFRKGDSFVTIIDFFLVSPNVAVQQVKTLNQDFRFSDHQPVWMEVVLSF
ncbi:MAG: endonuclease/exonuclease/phosphatase family protein [Saprospirales bacterium]|nr:endonuclease/exonuclease/phosphatase family protein [Saprospirales bacterium]